MPFHIGNVIISYTESYCYLALFISNNTVSNQIRDLVKSKQNHIYTYSSFIHENSQAPYEVKFKVLQAAVSSALLYGCESWFTDDMRCIDRAFIGCIKSLLGIRAETPLDLVFIETGTNPVHSLVVTRYS